MEKVGFIRGLDAEGRTFAVLGKWYWRWVRGTVERMVWEVVNW